MFSHPAPAPLPQQPSSARVPGDPAREQRWTRLTADWQPRLRVASPLEWAWLRSVWEALEDWQPPAEALPDDTETGADTETGPPGQGGVGDPARDRRLLDGALALQRAFDAAARAAAGDVVDEVFDGTGLDGTGPGEPSTAADPWVEEGEPLPEAPLGAQIARALIQRQGRTRVFAELWSVSHPGELAGDPWSDQPREPDAQGEVPVYPLSGDDIAWIVSGSTTAQKHGAWLWTGRFEV